MLNRREAIGAAVGAVAAAALPQVKPENWECTSHKPAQVPLFAFAQIEKRWSLAGGCKCFVKLYNGELYEVGRDTFDVVFDSFIAWTKGGGYTMTSIVSLDRSIYRLVRIRGQV